MSLGFFPSVRAADAWRTVPGLAMTEQDFASVCLVTISTPEYAEDRPRATGTGFLVAPNIVMTAAHVVAKVPGAFVESGARRLLGLPRWTRVVFGERVNTAPRPWVDTPRPNRAIQVAVNPDYVRTETREGRLTTDWYLDQYFADNALILLDGPVTEISGLVPKPFQFGSCPPVGRMALACGYGPTEEERPTAFRNRRYGASYVTHNTPTGIVARYPGELDVEGQVKGDSGGPLIVPASDGRPLVVGTLSQCWPTGVRQVFAGYTRIDRHLSWITSIMREWSDPETVDRIRRAPPEPGSSVLPWVLGGAAVLGVAALLTFGGKK